jgi:phage tail-like protein
MARSSKSDPVEKFRFRVTVIAFDLSLAGAVDTLANRADLGIHSGLKLITRAGFTEVTLPKATINEIPYRENIDNLRFIKIPGLAKYEPVTLKRGVTGNRNLYDWYRLVNEEIALMNVANELSKDAQFSVSQSDGYRKDVVIEVLDREGKSVKAWYLFNAWPSTYIPGNDLNASSDEKLLEEVTLTYEFFVEMEGGLEGFAKEIAKGALTVAANVLLERFKNGKFGTGSGLGF